MCALSFELGIATESWCAEFAFRKRVSMSATGSVIVMGISYRSPGFDARSTDADLWCGRGGCPGPVQLGVSLDLKGNPSCLSSARPSSSFLAVVTTVMSMPRTRSILSWSISWNTDCSVRPKV
jgi:hypothetical protein